MVIHNLTLKCVDIINCRKMFSNVSIIDFSYIFGFFLLFLVDSLTKAQEFVDLRPRRYRCGDSFDEPTVVGSLELSSSDDDYEHDSEADDGNVSIGEHEIHDDAGHEQANGSNEIEERAAVAEVN